MLTKGEIIAARAMMLRGARHSEMLDRMASGKEQSNPQGYLDYLSENGGIESADLALGTVLREFLVTELRELETKLTVMGVEADFSYPAMMPADYS